MENDTQVCDLSWNQQEFNDSIEEKTPVRTLFQYVIHYESFWMTILILLILLVRA